MRELLKHKICELAQIKSSRHHIKMADPVPAQGDYELSLSEIRIRSLESQLESQKAMVRSQQTQIANGQRREADLRARVMEERAQAVDVEHAMSGPMGEVQQCCRRACVSLTLPSSMLTSAASACFTLASNSESTA